MSSVMKNWVRPFLRVIIQVMSFVSPAALKGHRNVIYLDVPNVLESKDCEEKEETRDFMIEESVAACVVCLGAELQRKSLGTEDK